MNEKIAWFVRGICDNYWLVIFQNFPNITHRFAACGTVVVAKYSTKPPENLILIV